MFTVNRDPSSRELRKFGTAMLIGFSVLGLLLWWRAGVRVPIAVSFWTVRRVLAMAFVGTGIVLFATSRGPESLARKVYVTWMSVFVPVGVVMSTIMLTIVFFFFLPIFSLIVRMNDPLRKKLRKGGTYWEDYKPFEPTLERMRRLF